MKLENAEGVFPRLSGNYLEKYHFTSPLPLSSRSRKFLVAASQVSLYEDQIRTYGKSHTLFY